MKSKKLYTIIENGNSLGSLSLINENLMSIEIIDVIDTPIYGPSGLLINDKIYKLIVNGDYVNKTDAGIYISEQLSGIPNRIFIGQEILLSYIKKPIGSGEAGFSPTYNLSYQENINNMCNDVIVKVIDVISFNDMTYIDVLSNSRLYWVDNGTMIISNISIIKSNENKITSPYNLYVTNLTYDDNIQKSSIDFYFSYDDNTESYIIKYRCSDVTGNTNWIYENIGTNKKFTITNLEKNKNYEISIMSKFNDIYSLFSKTTFFKT